MRGQGGEGVNRGKYLHLDICSIPFLMVCYWSTMVQKQMKHLTQRPFECFSLPRGNKVLIRKNKKKKRDTGQLNVRESSWSERILSKQRSKFNFVEYRSETLMETDRVLHFAKIRWCKLAFSRLSFKHFSVLTIPLLSEKDVQDKFNEQELRVARVKKRYALRCFSL